MCTIVYINIFNRLKIEICLFGKGTDSWQCKMWKNFFQKIFHSPYSLAKIAEIIQIYWNQELLDIHTLPQAKLNDMNCTRDRVKLSKHVLSSISHLYNSKKGNDFCSQHKKTNFVYVSLPLVEQVCCISFGWAAGRWVRIWTLPFCLPLHWSKKHSTVSCKWIPSTSKGYNETVGYRTEVKCKYHPWIAFLQRIYEIKLITILNILRGWPKFKYLPLIVDDSLQDGSNHSQDASGSAFLYSTS